jgi:hypothetical protein
MFGPGGLTVLLPKVKMPNRDGFISKYPEKH